MAPVERVAERETGQQGKGAAPPEQWGGGRVGVADGDQPGGGGVPAGAAASVRGVVRDIGQTGHRHDGRDGVAGRSPGGCDGVHIRRFRPAVLAAKVTVAPVTAVDRQDDGIGAAVARQGEHRHPRFVDEHPAGRSVRKPVPDREVAAVVHEFPWPTRREGAGAPPALSQDGTGVRRPSASTTRPAGTVPVVVATPVTTR